MEKSHVLKKAAINSTLLFQNVPVRTAKDWADEVKLFCQGKLKMTNFSFMKQDNTNHNIISTDGCDLATVAATPTKDLGLVRQNIKVKTDQEVCNVCSKPFKFKTTLKNHMKKVHGIESLENGNDIEGPVNQEPGPVKQEAGPEKEEKDLWRDLLEQELEPVKQELGPVKQESGSVKEKSGPVKQKSGLVKQELGPVKQESGPLKLESVPVKKKHQLK